MGDALTVEFDVDGDILRLSSTAPYASQDSNEVDDGVIVRSNPDSGCVEGIEILFFSRRFGRGSRALRLPVGVKMHQTKGPD